MAEEEVKEQGTIPIITPAEEEDKGVRFNRLFDESVEKLKNEGWKVKNVKQFCEAHPGHVSALMFDKQHVHAEVFPVEASEGQVEQAVSAMGENGSICSAIMQNIFHLTKADDSRVRKTGVEVFEKEDENGETHYVFVIKLDSNQLKNKRMFNTVLKGLVATAAVVGLGAGARHAYKKRQEGQAQRRQQKLREEWESEGKSLEAEWEKVRKS